jgi:two-component system cell cycle sensor histidine kinase/response regulator CckA
MAVFAADSEGRLRYRLPLVTYTNTLEPVAHTLWMSPQVEAVTGYTPAEWVGRPGFFEAILHPDDRASVVEEMRRSREQLLPFSRDYRLRSRDERDVWVHDESVPVLDQAERPEFIQGYFVDITERKQLEEALRQSQKTEALGRLATGIAHDFNNFLVAIAGSAELATRALEPGHAAARLLATISEVAQSAQRLTRQLLAFSRRQDLSPETLDLSDIVRSVESMLGHLAGPGIPIELDLADEIAVHADLGQLEQVLVNLVTNARDAAPDVIGIETSRTAIDRGAESERLHLPPGEYAVLAVRDTGNGIDAETAARMFDPFFTTKPRDAGTGLGLSTVHGIVRQSGGAIDVSTTPGAGTTFRILLPLARTDAPSVQSPVPTAPPATPGVGGETILVVEDEPSVRGVVTAMLEQEGFSVLAAATPDEAAELGARPDLVLADLTLQGEDGQEIAARICALQPDDVAVVFMSGVVCPELDPRAAFIQKPFTSAELIRAVRAALAASRKPRR